MSAFYKIAYQVGFHPWEDLADHPPFADTLTRLIAREEGDGGPPFGRALDVGSGSGVWGVRLAQRGWDVTGVELVTKAVARAPAARGDPVRHRGRVPGVADHRRRSRRH